jgi:hypothetical protein
MEFQDKAQYHLILCDQPRPVKKFARSARRTGAKTLLQQFWSCALAGSALGILKRATNETRIIQGIELKPFASNAFIRVQSVFNPWLFFMNHQLHRDNCL